MRCQVILQIQTACKTLLLSVGQVFQAGNEAV